MNLFESSIEQLKTRDNSAYLEAVSKIYGILFESVFENPFPNADTLIRTNPGEALIHFAQQALAELKKLGGYDEETQTYKFKFYYPLINKAVIKKLREAANPDNKMSDQELYNTVINGISEFKEIARTEDKDAFAKFPISLAERKAFFRFKNFADTFCQDIIPKFKKLAPDFVDYGNKKKERLIPVSKDVFAEQPVAGADATGAAGEASPEVVPAEGDASVPAKKKKGSKKTEKAEESEQDMEEQLYEQYAKYIDADIGGAYNPDNMQEYCIVIPNVKDPNAVIARMKTGLDAVVKNKAGSGYSSYNYNAIQFEVIEGTHDIHMWYDPALAPQSSDPAKVNSRNNILMYCLYLDVRDRNNVPRGAISDAVAKSIEFDMRPKAANPNKKGAVKGGGQSILRSLMSQKDAETLASTGTVSSKMIFDQLPATMPSKAQGMPPIQVEPVVKEQLANAIRSYIRDLSKSELEEMKNASDDSGYRQSFFDSVIAAFSSKIKGTEQALAQEPSDTTLTDNSLSTSADDPISDDIQSEWDTEDDNQFRAYLTAKDESGKDMYDKVMDDLTSSGLTTVTVGANKFGDPGRQVIKEDTSITPDTYNGQASLVININIAAQTKEKSSSFTHYSRNDDAGRDLSAEELAALYADEEDTTEDEEEGDLIKTTNIRR